MTLTATRTVGPLTVRIIQCIGTDLVEATAWEPEVGHSTITREGGSWLGRVGTERLPAEVEAMRGGSPERIAAADRLYRLGCERARAAIEVALPTASYEGRWDGGALLCSTAAVLADLGTATR